MDRDEARKAAEVMLAYAEGKEIECKTSYEPDYRDVEMPLFDWGRCDYRVKPEPKYRPFRNAEECIQRMLKHQPYAWVKSKANDIMYAIHAMANDTALIADYEGEGHIFCEYKELFDDYEFIDGAPFGIKEEE